MKNTYNSKDKLAKIFLNGKLYEYDFTLETIKPLPIENHDCCIVVDTALELKNRVMKEEYEDRQKYLKKFAMIKKEKI